MVQKTSSQLSSLIRGFPGLGIIPYLNDNYPQRIFKKWSLEMKEPVIAVRMGGKDIVVVNTYDEAFEVCCGYRQKIKTKKYFNIPFLNGAELRQRACVRKVLFTLGLML